VDGQARPKNHRIGEGERVAVETPAVEAKAVTPEAVPFEIVY